jgi:PAS domain S-box-containing protein
MGKPIGIATTERDITERKRAEEALKESEEKFRNIFDNATDGIILTDLENQEIYSMNKSMCQMLGYGLGEFNKLKMADIHPKEDMPYVFEQVEKQLKGAFTPAKDIPMKRKDGSVFYVSVRGTPIILSGKRYLLGIFRDVTERKNMEEEMRKRLHELEVFYKASVGREERIIELKKEIEMLKKELGK